MHSFGLLDFVWTCLSPGVQNLAQIYPQTVPPTLQLTRLAEHMAVDTHMNGGWVGFEALQSNHFLPKILITERKKKS